MSHFQWIQPNTPPNKSARKKALIIYLNITTRLRLCGARFPSALLAPCFYTKTLYAVFLSAISATYPVHFILLDSITQIILFVEYKSLISSLLPRHLVPLWPKYLPQHRILQHLQPIFLPQYERPVLHQYNNNKMMVLNIVTFIYFCLSNWNKKDFSPNSG
jgi:hypothetical protein